MTATFEEAYDEILAVFKTAWDPTGHPAIWPNVKGDPPKTATPWARVSLVHVPGGQATLSGDTGRRRYTRLGILTVQVFTPSGEGLSEGHQLAKIIADAYEGTATSSQIWFRDVGVIEVGPSGSWYQINVTVNFTYDEVK